MGLIDERLPKLGIDVSISTVPKAAIIETHLTYIGYLRVSGQC